jgi:metal-responsive CopG/Arc/MetJ family transcriptional regulator
MAIGKDKTPVTVIIPNELLKEIDIDAEKDVRSRTSFLLKIIMEHYEEKGKQKDV